MFKEYPMELYFPQELFYELWRSDSTAAAPTTNDATSGSGENTADASDHDNKTSDGDKSEESNAAAAQKEPRFDVVHTIRYTPWAPTPNSLRTESQVVGTCRTIREANDLVLKEVYEKYGGLAHMSMVQPPNPSWIRRAAAGGTWPSTWKMEDGCLSFVVVNSKLQYTLKGEIFIVKW
ncbi:hypothetical protein F4861DRAFT_545728 [Xylaria intraflava]|nr:hypothetical protein F4861DRAFT_545728 [Xylaria intraflava]